ncbi:MAG TPA: type III pantothenate kinase [Bacteroidales bacterium]|jgi:type III pantothenate kinase|nr:type III pantothenate kinase [Bacteroidales bacterium]MDD4086346.1 type III pantothenate kinase [Bacteroidales bacterium]MDY0086103.1 type III pantothenate kinase [Bacteroidales bacterium]HPE43266.1 type III pantothenate kinase [Bacteroidales bacterium]
MNIKIILDIGNTLIKLAHVESGRLRDVKSFEDEEILLNSISEQSFSGGIIGSVREMSSHLLDWTKRQNNILLLNSDTPLPFKIAYKSPQSLGADRIALAAAAYERFPDKNVLVIDMGSCITYDLLTAQGVYLGGAISPGIRMRFKAMNAFTAKLPMAEPTDKTPLIGYDTESSLQSGVMNGVQAEIEGVIDRYASNYKDLTVLIGGGDNKYFDKRFKVNIFAASNLVLEGLRFIMEFNESQ